MKQALRPLFLHFKKAVALLVAQCFVFSFVLSPSLSALVEERRDAAAGEKAFEQFLLPVTAGRITGAGYSGSGRVVIAVQDLHCHPEVQKNIRTILALIEERYGLSKIYLEGASGRVDLSWLDFAGDGRLREKALQSLVEKGALTGAEYFAASSGRPDLLFGLEDRPLHAENLRRLGALLTEQDKALPLLALLKNELEPLARAYYTGQHRDFERLREKHRQGRVDTRKFYLLLKKYADTLGIDVHGYRNIASFLELAEREKALDYPRAAAELQRFVLRARQELPYGVYAALLERTGNFSRLDEAYPLLAALDREYGIAGGRFPDLEKFFRYLDASRRVNPVRLLREESALSREIRFRLSRSSAEKEVVFLTDFFRYLEDYLSHRISAEDYGYFTARKSDFRAAWIKYTGNAKIAALDPFREELDRYYRANLERNLSFIRNIAPGGTGTGSVPAVGAASDSPDKVLSSLARAREIDVVVTGGFHTGALAQLLAANNISYLI
ncbi:MAG: hypothetical protein ACYC5N_08585, partial [Endomicrobiales bacterium]